MGNSNLLELLTLDRKMLAKPLDLNALRQLEFTEEFMILNLIGQQ